MNRTLLKLVAIQIKDFIREPEILFWAILFPICISGVLGLAFSQQNEAVRNVAIIETKDAIPSIEEFTKKISPEKFNLIRCAEEEAILKLKRGEISLYLKSDISGKLSYYFDPKNADAELTYLLLEKEANKRPVIERPTIAITSKGNRYIDFLIPGLLAMGIMNSCIWGVGWSLIDARIKKLLRRMIATPMKKSTFLTAHIITRLLVTFCEGSILFLFAYFAFGVEIQGSIAALLILFVTGIFAFAGIAILTSSRVENTQVGNGIINAVVLPMTIISGVFFSYHNFPEWTQGFIRYFPLTILADNIRAVFNEGVGVISILKPAAILLITGLVSFITGLKIYKWY